MQHRDYIILKKINDEIDVAIDMMDTMTFTEFDSDEKTKRAICMTVINIGELVKNLSDDIRQNNTHIPWRSIAGFRDIAAHKYSSLFMDDVYNSVKKDFPELKNNITDIIDI